MKRRGNWVFDKPLANDPLFIVGVMLGLVGVAYYAFAGDLSMNARIFKMVLALPSAIMFVAIIGGSGREFRRARRHPT